MGNGHPSPRQLLEAQAGVSFPRGPGQTTQGCRRCRVRLKPCLWELSHPLSSPGGASLFRETFFSLLRQEMVQGQKGPVTVPSASRPLKCPAVVCPVALLGEGPWEPPS